MTTSAVRDTTIAWSRDGAGPTAVFAHGLTASRARDVNGPFDWSPVVAAGRTLVAYDARGHGESGGTPEPATYVWSELASDLLALLDVVAPDESVSGLGCSMGTGTLLHAAVREPDRFDRLVLTAPPTAWATRAEQSALYRTAADVVDARGVAALLELLGGRPLPPVFAELAGYPQPPDIRDDLLAAVLRGAALSDLPDERDVATLTVPVLVLAWADDPGHPVSTAERLCALLPHASLVVAHTPAQLREWGDRAASFLSR